MIRLVRIDFDGTILGVEDRKVFKVKSSNYRFEAGALKGIAYNTAKRPIGIFAHAIDGTFPYMLVDRFQAPRMTRSRTCSTGITKAGVANYGERMSRRRTFTLSCQLCRSFRSTSDPRAVISISASGLAGAFTALRFSFEWTRTPAETTDTSRK